MSDEKSTKNIAGLMFVGCMFVGAGLGLFFGHVAAGGALGMGVGFLAMGVVWANYRNRG